MKALILNSGLGSRMGVLTSVQPKCMTEINENETIVSRQLRQLADFGIKEVVMTTGKADTILEEYCNSLNLPLNIIYVKNPVYQETNYIYSIYCAKEYLDDDIILMHGDLVFEQVVLDRIMAFEKSCVAVSSVLPLPEKDFKAVIKEDKVKKIGIEFFEDAYACQPLYKLYKREWRQWLDSIIDFCEAGQTKCYAENAFNCISEQCELYPFDVKEYLCSEIDNPEDLSYMIKRLKEVENRTVYMCFSTDVIHNGHITMIKKAKNLGKLIVGVMTDDVVASYKRFPLLSYEDRKALFENISGVTKVVKQDALSYRKNIQILKPDFVVHGDDWKTGNQKVIREEVIECLNEYGGSLIEYPYASNEEYKRLEERMRLDLSLPDLRRGRLRKLLGMKGLITVIEAHNGITGLIAEKTTVAQDGGVHQFDAMWVSSLCDSTAKGKPDIELVDMTSRYQTINDIMEVTTKPIIFDGDTGGLTEHFIYTVRTLERIGVSMVIIEDKKGLKKNSLFGTEVVQTQDTIEGFCEKIKAGKKAQKTKDFMICARIESLILEQGMEDALERAFAYVDAGADAIMIHSRRKDPDEIFTFVERFRKNEAQIPIVVVPTSFNTVTEEEFKERGVNMVIYANQLTRTGFPAMQRAAETILKHHRAKECDEMCMSIKEIITLIPDAD